ncbi:MAG: tetratricopeptide repeat protein [bacterium]
MKHDQSFWRSLEKYGWRVVRRSPLPWQWIGVGLVVSVMGTSMINGKNSVVGARDLREVSGKAAERGDYQTAQKLYARCQVTQCHEQVLGAETELEDKIYPEKVVERRVRELETKLEDYPGNKEIFVTLAELYREIGDIERAQEYLEQARVLDPNDPIFQP